MSGSIPVKDQKLLAMKSGCLCAIPSCKKRLIIEKTNTDDDSIVGEMAHIKGERKDAARYDETFDIKKLNKYNNLILLCNVCHKMIDDQYNEYTVEKLHKIKLDHEVWVDQILQRAMSSMTFAELEVITKYLVSDNFGYEETYELTNPVEKIQKNGLAESTSRLIAMGMTQVKLVEQYIDSNLDNSFGERLRDGFVKEYVRLTTEGLKGDEMFYSLLGFAGGLTNDPKRNSAGLAVLVHLFEKCEVFEK